MLVCPQIALSLLAGWVGGGGRARTEARSRSSEWQLNYSSPRHHARYISPVTTLPLTSRVYAAQCPSLPCLRV
ncbi:hypothetical protein E2C01_055879 [Portunus trituberculatus]|uniref:Secreted protein n=1 Tax=Portunus trituberculatus TaxID=210409 RepID=A0A5B7GSG0_PORTR|nr:hypothetical protein [Portunus trituberculatus]